MIIRAAFRTFGLVFKLLNFSAAITLKITALLWRKATRCALYEDQENPHHLAAFQIRRIGFSSQVAAVATNGTLGRFALIAGRKMKLPLPRSGDHFFPLSARIRS